MAAGSALLVGLVEEFVSGQQDSKAADTATGISLTILSLCSLHLASSQPQTRARGVQLLSNVLQQCHGDLTEREVEVLLVFYENRLKDHYVITPHVLKGLKALTKCSVLPPGSAVSILKSLFQDVHVQVSTSNLLCQVIKMYVAYLHVVKLMDHFSHPTELKGLGADFVFGFVQSVDGERDPRNLLLAFQIARKIIHGGYDLGKFTEELFEVTSCYFPIDFSPPPNDPHGITQEELILALRAVLTGTPRFAEFLLPLIIEKLDSDVQSAKVDSLQTLTACASVYEHKELAEFLPGLWASLRREVFQTASERVESAGLAALGALTACLSRSVLNSDSEDYLNVFLDLVLKDCQHHLCEPDLKLVWPSAKLLQATSTASYRASHRVAAAIMPSLIEQYNSRTQCAQRRTLLEVLQGFVQPVKSSEEDESVLLDFRQSLCSIVFSALSENSAGLQITSLRVLTALSQQTGKTPDHFNCFVSSPLEKYLYLTHSKHTHTAIILCRSQLFSLLSDSELGSLAADGFSLLMSDSPDVLNRGCNADVRIMYRQRFFTENSAKLVQGFNSANKSGYLKALSHIVNNLPRQVQLTELPALLPLLLEALSCPDQAVQLSTLSCLQPVLMDPPSALITQLEALVGRTLTLTTSPAMKVRIASLRCIHALSRFPEHEIMPFRARVLRALAVPLDDLKRMVRSEAVVARNEWFLLGSPGGR
uniref:MMS19 nucleotide excision repair protein n=1 Tax=Hucho hucho TaxID=62062 RepID=A0A4W5MVS0_9TELE